MTLDINGYNSIFKSFVSFAQERHDANQVKAVADAHVNRLDGHRVLAVTHSETDLGNGRGPQVAAHARRIQGERPHP